jgi:hypothetical protein
MGFGESFQQLGDVLRVGLGDTSSEFVELSGLVCGLFRVGLAKPSSRLGFATTNLETCAELLCIVFRVTLSRAPSGLGTGVELLWDVC